MFEGVATAIVTPFNQGTIDFPVMNRLLDLQLAAGVDAIVVCGTTGEASTMTDNEKLALIAHTVQYCAGRCKVIAGTDTRQPIRKNILSILTEICFCKFCIQQTIHDAHHLSQ